MKNYLLCLTKLKFIAIIIIIFNFVFSFGQKKYVKTVKDFGLTNEVIETDEKKYEMFLLSSSDGKPVEQFKIKKSSIKFFNSEGFLMKEKARSGYSSSKDEYNYKFNKDNFLIEFNSKTDFNRSNKTINKYNENNLLIEQSIYDYDRLKYQYLIKYKGKKINKKIYINNFRNSRGYKCSYKHKKQKLISSECIYNDKRKEITNIFYDKNSIKSKTIISLYKNNSLLEKDTIIHDKIGNYIKKSHHDYDSNNKISNKWIKNYNKKGLETSFHLGDGTLITTKYDHLQNETDMITSDKNAPNYIAGNKYIYKYDKRGNWVIKCHKRKKRRDTIFKPLFATKRIIKYKDSTISKVTKEEALHFCDPNYKNRLKEFMKTEEYDTYIEDISVDIIKVKN